MAAYEETNPVAGDGLACATPPGLLAWGICERVDDYCVHLVRVLHRPRSPVPPVDVAAATADIGRRPYEQPSRMETVADLTQIPST